MNEEKGVDYVPIIHGNTKDTLLKAYQEYENVSMDYARTIAFIEIHQVSLEVIRKAICKVNSMKKYLITLGIAATAAGVIGSTNVVDTVSNAVTPIVQSFDEDIASPVKEFVGAIKEPFQIYESFAPVRESARKILKNNYSEFNGVGHYNHRKIAEEIDKICLEKGYFDALAVLTEIVNEVPEEYPNGRTIINYLTVLNGEEVEALKDVPYRKSALDKRVHEYYERLQSEEQAKDWENMEEKGPTL